MTDSTALVELEKRLAEATGPDREIDEAIMDALFPKERVSNPGDVIRMGWKIGDGYWRSIAWCLTDSIDDALALCRATSHKHVRISCLPDGSGFAQVVRLTHEYDADSPATPIAICLALVRALQSQSKREAGDV